MKGAKQSVKQSDINWYYKHAVPALEKAKLESSRSLVSQVPISESISRKRTFTIAQLREDFKDAQTQLVVLLTQLHDENFHGSLQINFSEGRVCTVETVEKQRL